MTNIWALEKDESIKLLLLLLREQLGSGGFVIVDSQELHPRAIRLAKTDEPAISAYLYTYGQAAGTYGVHLELPDHGEEGGSNAMGIYEGIYLERLASMLCVHFDLTAC